MKYKYLLIILSLQILSGLLFITVELQMQTIQVEMERETVMQNRMLYITQEIIEILQTKNK